MQCTLFFFYTLCAFPILSPRLTFDLYLPQNIPVAAADDSGYGWYRALLFSSNSVRFCVKSDPSNYLKSKHFYWQSSIKKNLRAGWMFPHCRVSQRKQIPSLCACCRSSQVTFAQLGLTGIPVPVLVVRPPQRRFLHDTRNAIEDKCYRKWMDGWK